MFIAVVTYKIRRETHRSATLWKTDATMRSLSSSGTSLKPKCVVEPECGAVEAAAAAEEEEDAVERLRRRRAARGARRSRSDGLMAGRS
jgi:hypothetical protein